MVRCKVARHDEGEIRCISLFVLWCCHHMQHKQREIQYLLQRTNRKESTAKNQLQRINHKGTQQSFYYIHSHNLQFSGQRPLAISVISEYGQVMI